MLKLTFLISTGWSERKEFFD